MAFQAPFMIPNLFPPENLLEVQFMVESLCQEANFATRIRIREVKDGFEDCRVPCVLKTSKLKAPSVDTHDHTLQRMAAFYHLAYDKINVPYVIAYDSTCDNFIQCSYMILGFLRGQSLPEHLHRLRSEGQPNEEDFKDFGGCLAVNIIQREMGFQFSHYGFFAPGREMKAKSSKIDRRLDQISLAICPFVFGSLHMEAGSTAIDFIINILDASEHRIRTPLQEERYRKLVDIASCIKVLEDPSHPAHKPQPSVLWHPDYEPHNLLYRTEDYHYNPDVGASEPEENMPAHYEREIRARQTFLQLVLGWEGVLALPRIMTRCPPFFIWDGVEELDAEGRAEVKAFFDEHIELMIPGYCADAYGEAAKMVRALGIYALMKGDYEWPELSWDGLMESWDNYVAGNQARE